VRPANFAREKGSTFYNSIILKQKVIDAEE